MPFMAVDISTKKVRYGFRVSFCILLNHYLFYNNSKSWFCFWVVDFSQPVKRSLTARHPNIC